MQAMTHNQIEEVNGGLPVIIVAIPVAKIVGGAVVAGAAAVAAKVVHNNNTTKNAVKGCGKGNVASTSWTGSYTCK